MSNDKKYEMDKTFLEEVIISTTERRGKGVDGDPIRIVTKVYSKTGLLIAEHDPKVANDNNVMRCKV